MRDFSPQGKDTKAIFRSETGPHRLKPVPQPPQRVGRNTFPAERVFKFPCKSMIFELARGVHFCWRWHAASGGTYGDFHGGGSGNGDFPGVGDFGDVDSGMGDARDVFVDGESGADCAGEECGCGQEIGDGAGESFGWADEFADAVRKS